MLKLFPTFSGAVHVRHVELFKKWSKHNEIQYEKD